MKRRSLLITGFIMLLILAVLVPVGCGQKGNTPVSAVGDQPRSGGIFRYPLADDPLSLDPAQFDEELGIDVGKEIYDGLVDVDYKTNKVIPAHAESWDIKDNKVFTFHLKKQARFHNGKEVTAEDFRYSFDRLLDPETAAKMSWLMQSVKGAEARISRKDNATEGLRVIDKYTLEITLEQANSSFLSYLAYPAAAVLDKSVVEKNSKTFGATGAGPQVVVGSGPFKLSQWLPKNVIKLVRNDDYCGRKAYLDGVDFRIIPDETTTLNEFRAGNLDFAKRIPPGQYALVEKEFAGQEVRNSLWQLEYFGFNLTKAPFKDNIKLRQALNFAIDREGIIKAVVEGMGVPAKGIISPGMPEYNRELKGYTYDPAKAEALMAEAGYPGGQGLPEVVLSYGNHRETHQKVAEAVQAQLKQIGLEVKLGGLPLPEYRQKFDAGSLDIFKLGFSADSLDAGSFLYPLFNSKNNDFRYSNPQVDKLLNTAQSVADDKQRIKLYMEAEQIIVDDAPAIFLYHPVTIYLRGTNIQGVQENPMDLIPLSDIWISG